MSELNKFISVIELQATSSRMYLQALRFLWVIAADERLLCPLENNDFKNFIKTDVEVTYKVSCSLVFRFWTTS